MYVVIENTPGYLPENDSPPECDTIDEAVSCLLDEVARYCDHLAEIGEPFTVSWTDDGQSAAVSQYQRPHDLGRVFEIHMTEDGDA